MKCSKCRAKGHNKKACPMNRSQVSVELPTPPPASMSFLLVLLSLILSCNICKLIDSHLICFYFVQTQSISSSTLTLTRFKHRVTQKVLSHNFLFLSFWICFICIILMRVLLCFVIRIRVQ